MSDDKVVALPISADTARRLVQVGPDRATDANLNTYTLLIELRDALVAEVRAGNPEAIKAFKEAGLEVPEIPQKVPQDPQ